MGDFNIHLDDEHDSDTRSFNELLKTFGWRQEVEEMTHTSGHTIDLCITSINSILHLTKPSVGYFLSDHAFISFKANVPKPHIQKTLIKSRAISRIDKEVFQNDLQNLTTQLLNSSDALDVTTLAMQYDQQLTKVLDRHAPLKSRLITPRTCVAWFDNEARTQKSKLRKQEKHWRKSKDPNDLLKLKSMRRLYRQHLNSSKATHFKDSIKAAKGNPQQLFSITRGLMGKHKTSNLPDSSDDHTLANEFADHFISKIEKIREDLKLTQRYTPTTRANSILNVFTDVTEDSVHKIIKTAKQTNLSNKVSSVTIGNLQQ